MFGDLDQGPQPSGSRQVPICSLLGTQVTQQEGETTDQEAASSATLHHLHYHMNHPHPALASRKSWGSLIIYFLHVCEYQPLNFLIFSFYGC